VLGARCWVRGAGFLVLSSSFFVLREAKRICFQGQEDGTPWRSSKGHLGPGEWALGFGRVQETRDSVFSGKDPG
jgi:hypothetical protein